MPRKVNKDPSTSKGILAKGPRLVKNMANSVISRTKKLSTSGLIKAIHDDFEVAKTDLRRKIPSLYGADESEDDAFRNVELPRDPVWDECIDFVCSAVDVSKRCDALGPVVTESQVSAVVLEVLGQERAAEVEEFTKEIIDIGVVFTTVQPITPEEPRFILKPFCLDSDDEDDTDKLVIDSEPASVAHMQYVRHLQDSLNKFGRHRPPKHPVDLGVHPTSFNLEKELNQAGMHGHPTASHETDDESEEESN